MDLKVRARSITQQVEVYGEQFWHCLRKHWSCISFIREHRIWEGFYRYGWVSKLLILVALIAGLKFIDIFIDWINTLQIEEPEDMIVGMSALARDVFEKEFKFLFSSGMKYVMIILLEIIIFHVSRRTLEILTSEASDASFKGFVRAQIRMIKVAIRSWVMELLMVQVLLGTLFSIFGFLGFLESSLAFAVQSYFLGLAVVDNYNEQFDLTIKDSVKYTRKYIGVAIAAGLFLQLIFFVPVAGTIIGPFLSAVAVTITMYEIADLHLRSEGSEKGPQTTVAQA